MRELWYCHDCCEPAEVFEREMVDPFGTGDSPTEYEVTCRKCDSFNVEREFLCDCCEQELPFGDHEDCATCIAHGRYSHERFYELEDIQDAINEVAAQENLEVCSLLKKQAG